MLESQSAFITVDKPGNLTGRTLTLIVEARGEAQLNVTFNVAMTRLEANSGAVIETNGSIRVDQPAMSAFGQRIQWTQLPPDPTWQADLDGSLLKFAAVLRHDFTVRLECGRDEQSCAADGDVITTVVQLASPQDGRVKAQEVTVQTRVVALASCGRSVAIAMQSEGLATRAQPVKESLLANAAHVFVDLDVIDADSIPIRLSVPSAAVLWGSGEGPARPIVPTKAAEGGSQSNRFTASIDASLRSTPGSYRLQVVLKDAWNEALGAVGDCVVLEQVIRVEKPEGLNTVWLSVGSLSACAVFVGLIVFWARRLSAELKNVLLMVLTEASKTVLSVSFALGNLATDLLTTYRVVFEGIVQSPQYRVPYAVFGCLSITVGLVSIVYHVRRAAALRSQIKSNAVAEHEPAETDTDLEADSSHAAVQKLKWELEKASRDLKALAVGLLGFLFEDVPMVRAHRPDPRS
jgi:hypothetical protein